MKKPLLIASLVILAFLLLMLGFFFGRFSKDGSIEVYTQGSNRSENISADQYRQPLLININTATSRELQDLPGIGPTTADAIIAYREENGPFKYTIELMNVKGIGRSTFNEISSMITVSDE